MKPGTLFIITVNWDGELFTSIRERFIDTLQVRFGFNLTSYLVALEKSDKSDNVTHHLHSVIEFEKPVYVSDIAEYLRVFY